MEQARQVTLLERARAHAEHGTTDASDRTTRFDASIYTDELRLANERATLFKKFPLLVGYSDQLRTAGDYVTHDWSGAPILLCRQTDGSLKAFLNICRHRGTRLVPGRAGHTEKSFVCPYHAWSYDTAGKLRGVPCAQHFKQVERETSGLFELAVLELAGLVFVTPDPASTRHTSSYFADYGQELELFGLPSWEVYATKTVHGKLNWKMMIEANQESYHINVLHRETAGPRFAAQLSLFDTLGPHTRTVLLHKQFAGTTLDDDASRWRILDHSDLVYFLFPNTLILLSRESAHVLTAFPQAKDRTVVQGATLVPPGTTSSYPRMLYQKYWSTILEDIAVSEPIQATSQYDADIRLWLGANETLIAHFHEAIARALSEGT